jgi:hypothetical protein
MVFCSGQCAGEPGKVVLLQERLWPRTVFRITVWFVGITKGHKNPLLQSLRFEFFPVSNDELSVVSGLQTGGTCCRLLLMIGLMEDYLID